MMQVEGAAVGEVCRCKRMSRNILVAGAVVERVVVDVR